MKKMKREKMKNMKRERMIAEEKGMGLGYGTGGGGRSKQGEALSLSLSVDDLSRYTRVSCLRHVSDSYSMLTL